MKSSIPERMRLAWRVFRDGLPWRRSTKAAPMAWPAWREGRPEWQITDYDAYVNEGFNANSLIYSAISYKARAINAAPLRAYSGDPDQLDPLKPTDPLAQLLARPQPHQSGTEFMRLNTVYLNLSGNVYIYMDRPKRGGPPQAMYTLRPDRVRIIPERGGLRGYLYIPEGQSEQDALPILPADLMHVKLPNPSDPLEGLGYGLSPLSALAQSGDVDNRVTSFLNTFFKRGTMVQTLLKFDTPLTDEAIARIRERWHSIYGGSENWSEVGVLDESGSVERVGLTFDQMGFEAIDERNEARILGPFGVPPILIGTRTGLLRSTYSNFEQARRAFWEDTFIPELGLFETEFDYYLAPAPDIFIRFDLSGVPALREDTTKQVDAASKLWAMGIPANTALRAVGISIGDVDGGDTGYLPLSLVPVSMAGQAPAGTAPETGETAAEQETPPAGKSRVAVPARVLPFRGGPQGPERRGQGQAVESQ